LANNYFTFWERRFRGPAILQGLAIFELVSVLGVIVHVAVFQFLQTHHVGVDLLGENLARVVHESFGFMTAFVSNYFLNVNYTWRRRTVI
jgi:dolichol-phosphate mannosyltransferase